MVALLHGMGALPGFIARSVQWHYFISALGSALLGTLVAALLFLAAGGLAVLHVEAVPFLPPLSLRWNELAWLALVPAVTAAIAWMTARLSVLAPMRDYKARHNSILLPFEAVEKAFSKRAT